MLSLKIAPTAPRGGLNPAGESVVRGRSLTAMPTPYTIALVVDPEFADRLESLASQMHVWVIDTPQNRRAAERIWASNPDGGIEVGVTTFKECGNNDSEAICLDILNTVDLHHGGIFARPTVFGARSDRCSAITGVA